MGDSAYFVIDACGAVYVTVTKAFPAVWGGPIGLRLEFAAIFIVTPLVMALGLPPQMIWSGLAGMFVVAVLLLSITKGFSWRSLMSRPLVPGLLLLTAFVLLTSLVAVGLVTWLRPHALFWLPRHDERLWLLIMVAYPFLSALPQEIVFRALFFARYGGLFPNAGTAIVVNGAVFSLAHLFYWNWPAVILTAAGGVIFAWAYQRRGSFFYAWLMHSIAGQIIFTTGLGMYFYHGAVGY
ncbi:CPBP family intramembrane glutamic endopeptidase [Microbaculum marinum]|uniref:CPBP family intramembrane glutamic endopeptidase n=1 Tax=Microbaculum marinum TaxID=1764581 RepID=A0AAW9RYW8_9HYPH